MELPEIHASFRTVATRQDIDLTQDFNVSDVVLELTRQRDYALACLQQKFDDIRKAVDSKKLLRFHLARPIDVTQITVLNNALIIAERLDSKVITLNPSKSLADQVIAHGGPLSGDTRDMVEDAKLRIDGPKLSGFF